jgi:hypothetical protein
MSSTHFNINCDFAMFHPNMCPPCLRNTSIEKLRKIRESSGKWSASYGLLNQCRSQTRPYRAFGLFESASDRGSHFQVTSSSTCILVAPLRPRALDDLKIPRESSNSCVQVCCIVGSTIRTSVKWSEQIAPAGQIRMAQCSFKRHDLRPRQMTRILCVDRGVSKIFCV